MTHGLQPPGATSTTHASGGGGAVALHTQQQQELLHTLHPQHSQHLPPVHVGTAAAAAAAAHAVGGGGAAALSHPHPQQQQQRRQQPQQHCHPHAQHPLHQHGPHSSQGSAATPISKTSQPRPRWSFSLREMGHSCVSALKKAILIYSTITGLGAMPAQPTEDRDGEDRVGEFVADDACDVEDGLCLPPGIEDLARSEMVDRGLKVKHSDGIPFPADRYAKYKEEVLPVRSEYAVPGQNFHFGESFTDSVEHDILTYDNGEHIMSKTTLYLKAVYNEDLCDYLEHAKIWKKHNPHDTRQIQTFPPFERWLGRDSLPTGQTLRDYYKAAHYFPGTCFIADKEAISRHQYRTQQMQAVGTKMPTVGHDGTSSNEEHTTASSDHTFNTAKNFGDVLGKQEHFTDNFPSCENVWGALWPWSTGRLDIFHWLKRISKTLRKNHAKFGVAVRELSEVVFWDNVNDLFEVCEALRKGTLNGKVHDDDQINELKASGDIQRKLEEWHRKWSGCFDPEIGEELFTRGTDDAVRQQLQRIHDIVDIADNHYVKRRSPPKSKHGLQEWTCVRGGKVESLHTEEGHFANQGMHPMLAQALTIEGLVQFTMDKEREVWYDAHQVATPAVGHYKPWLQVEANHLAELVSLPKPYPEQVGIGEDNGEVFLYDYFLQQQEREQLHREEYAANPTYCPCARCATRRKTCPCDMCAKWREHEASTRVDGVLHSYMLNHPDEAARQLVDRAVVLEEGDCMEISEEEATRLADSAEEVVRRHYARTQQEEVGPAQPHTGESGVQLSVAPQQEAGPSQPHARVARNNLGGAGNIQHSAAPQQEAGSAQQHAAAARSSLGGAGVQHSLAPQQEARPAQPHAEGARGGLGESGVQHSAAPQQEAGPTQPHVAAARSSLGGAGVQHSLAPQQEARIMGGGLAGPAQPHAEGARGGLGESGVQHSAAPQQEAGPTQPHVAAARSSLGGAGVQHSPAAPQNASLARPHAGAAGNGLGGDGVQHSHTPQQEAGPINGLGVSSRCTCNKAERIRELQDKQQSKGLSKRGGYHQHAVSCPEFRPRKKPRSVGAPGGAPD
ncbi:hypothetical protein CYMTET_48078 [Cymbomonas tetramitiformis]|uniref:Uncharacterized protein n=1 Tax=Cymbomonas tetramitiformis TaxID=36881 RepID=A0AAE0BSZ3_9CHLO|nr:hypothetical protein CYMTET_48078 [Cymbomonas tetramitiformis]